MVEELRKFDLTSLNQSAIFVDELQCIQEDELKFLSLLLTPGSSQQIVATGDDDVADNLRGYNLSFYLLLFRSSIKLTFFNKVPIIHEGLCP